MLKDRGSRMWNRSLPSCSQLFIVLCETALEFLLEFTIPVTVVHENKKVKFHIGRLFYFFFKYLTAIFMHVKPLEDVSFSNSN